MIQWIALRLSAPKYPSLAASPFTSPNSLRAGPRAGVLPGITNSGVPELEPCSQLVLLPFCSPSSDGIFMCPPAAPVSPVLHRTQVGSLCYIKAHQGVTLTSRVEQEVHFLFHGKILEFNLEVFFVPKCPCETIKKLFTYFKSILTFKSNWNIRETSKCEAVLE